MLHYSSHHSHLHSLQINNWMPGNERPTYRGVYFKCCHGFLSCRRKACLPSINLHNPAWACTEALQWRERRLKLLQALKTFELKHNLNAKSQMPGTACRGRRGDCQNSSFQFWNCIFDTTKAMWSSPNLFCVWGLCSGANQSQHGCPLIVHGHVDALACPEKPCSASQTGKFSRTGWKCTLAILLYTQAFLWSLDKKLRVHEHEHFFLYPYCKLLLQHLIMLKERNGRRKTGVTTCVGYTMLYAHSNCNYWFKMICEPPVITCAWCNV